MDWDPNIVELTGYVAAVLTTVAFVPQVAKTWRSKSADDLSIAMLATFTIGVALWLVYGLSLGAIPIVAGNATSLVLSVILVALRIRYTRQQPSDK